MDAVPAERYVHTFRSPSKQSRQHMTTSHSRRGGRAENVKIEHAERGGTLRFSAVLCGDRVFVLLVAGTARMGASRRRCCSTARSSGSRQALRDVSRRGQPVFRSRATNRPGCREEDSRHRAARHMRRWRRCPKYGQFVNENNLTLRETQFVVSWAEGLWAPKFWHGVLERRRRRECVPPAVRALAHAGHWMLGEPDLFASAAGEHDRPTAGWHQTYSSSTST